MKGWISALFMLSVAGCFSQKQEPTPPLKKQAQLNPKPKPKLKHQAPAKPDPCIEQGPIQVPYWVPQEGLVVTKFLNTCTTRQGSAGFLKNSAFVAMGFPCTGGKGKIDVSGTYWLPKMVGFVLDAGCPLGIDHSKASTALKTQLKLDDSSKLLAINPLSIQFWEIPGLNDTDVGFTINLKSPMAKQHTWRAFLDKNPIEVILFGRENSWVSNHQLYQVKAQIVYESKQTFSLKVSAVSVLKPEEIAVVKARCEALVPKRNCSKVF